MAMAWQLWLERNARVFEDKYAEASEVWCRVKFTALLWAFVSNQFGILSVNEIYSNWGAAMS